jgi:cytochrome c-type biogenesis protein CcmH
MMNTARMTALYFVFAVMMGFAAPAFAVEPDEVLADPAKEALAREISAELRCPVCQGQSIDDSNAPLSRDLRIVVREHIMAGESKGQILDFMASRYSEFVLLRPRLSARNMLLWLAPSLLLTFGLSAVVYSVRSSSGPRGGIAPSPLSDAEQAKLANILDEK